MPDSAPVSRLHGRERELDALDGALDAVGTGRLTISVVEGEAGIGKTRLLTEALDRGCARGFRAVAGKTEELERMRPFGLWTDTLRCSRSSPDPRRAAIAALLAPGAGDRGSLTVSSDPGLQFQAVDAVVDLVEALSVEEGPLVLGVDDLQWADPSSLLTLAAMARRLRDVPVAIIGCLRPEPRGEELRRTLEILDTADARHLCLGRLDDDAVLGLVSDAVAGDPGPTLLAAVRGAGGNPLFVTELVAAIGQGESVESADGRSGPDEAARPSTTTLPPALRVTILRRLGFLTDRTLEALRPAAVLGSSFSVSDLSTITARPVLDLTSALAPALRAHLLDDDGDRLRFRHDLIRDAVYEDLPGGVRVALHREAGRRLARADAPALQVAEHLARGADPADAEAISWLTRAAREAAPTSPGVAADLLGRAIGLCEPTDPGRDRLLGERARSLSWAGRMADTEATCRALLARNRDPAVQGPARVCLGHSLLAQGRMSDALGELEPSLRSSAATGTETSAAWGWASLARLSLGDLDGAETAAGRARSTADSGGEPVTTSLALNTLAVVAELRADCAGAVRIIDEAVQLADRSPGRAGHRYPVHVTRGHILLEADRYSDARATLMTGSRISEAIGLRWPLPSFQVFLAVERFATGGWDDAVTEFETAVELATETDERYSLVLGHSVMSLIALHRGDLRRADEAATAAACELATSGPRYRGHWATRVRALLLEARGSVPEAFATLTGCWDQCVDSGLAVEYPVLGPDLVRLALAVGEQSRAEQVTAAVGEVAAANDVASLDGAALRCRGLLARDPEPLLAAVDAYARTTRPLELALTCEEAAAALATRGSVDDAVPLHEQALGLFEQLDAARGVARTEARLRELGVRRGRRGTRRRPQLGWPSLTPTERTIVDLVVEGLSNPQIGHRLYISRRTVQTHLAHVFAKLDVSSRAQLAAEATRDHAIGRAQRPLPRSV